MVPGAVDQRRLMVDMPLQVLAGGRLQADVVGQSRFLGEQLEQGRHAANGAAQLVRRIEIMHLVGFIMHGGRMRRERETVADKQDFGGGKGRRGHQAESGRGAKQFSHKGSPRVFYNFVAGV